MSKKWGPPHKDLYSAEKQLTKAIPKMAKGSNDPALQTAFRDHLKETEGQIARLEEVARLLEIKPTGKKCNGMEGVIEEGAEALAEDGDETVLDLGIIGAGCRVEHYEIAGYTTAIGLAQRLKATGVITYCATWHDDFAPPGRMTSTKSATQNQSDKRDHPDEAPFACGSISMPVIQGASSGLHICAGSNSMNHSTSCRGTLRKST